MTWVLLTTPFYFHRTPVTSDALCLLGGCQNAAGENEKKEKCKAWLSPLTLHRHCPHTACWELSSRFLRHMLQKVKLGFIMWGNSLLQWLLLHGAAGRETVVKLLGHISMKEHRAIKTDHKRLSHVNWEGVYSWLSVSTAATDMIGSWICGCKVMPKHLDYLDQTEKVHGKQTFPKDGFRLIMLVFAHLFVWLTITTTQTLAPNDITKTRWQQSRWWGYHQGHSFS